MTNSVIPPPGSVSEVTSIVKQLDPNVLAVLLLTIVLNGLFFYVYVNLAQSRHVEFMAALATCPASSNLPARP